VSAVVVWAGFAWLSPLVLIIGLVLLFIAIMAFGGACEVSLDGYFLGTQPDGSWSYFEMRKNMTMAETIAKEIEERHTR